MDLYYDQFFDLVTFNENIITGNNSENNKLATYADFPTYVFIVTVMFMTS